MPYPQAPSCWSRCQCFLVYELRPLIPMRQSTRCLCQKGECLDQKKRESDNRQVMCKHSYNHILLVLFLLGDAVTWWLAWWSPDREVRVRALPGSLCCVVFLGKTLYSQSASLHSGVYGTSKLSAKPTVMLGGYLQWTSIPSRRSSNTPSRFMLQKPG